jgi:putative Mg2+ transporter-C (MgtC) family protein
MPLAELTLQLDLAVRLVVAAVLGAAIGLEREIHDHPAGMRTHLLVSLGAAIFTELSIYSFQPPGGGTGAVPTDPSRIAAQVVSGIGFLGAGAILKYGTSIRGLTTAASLWATAAIGMAAGAGAWVIGAVGAVIVIFSLWPLNVVISRLRLRDSRSLRVRLTLARLDALGGVSNTLAVQRVEISGINTQRLGKGRYEIELVLHLPSGLSTQQVIEAVTAVEGVELIESQVGTD